MKLLVLVTDYPSSENRGALAFVHSRDVSYASLGHIVHVLNFSSKNDYVVDDIPVFTYASITKYKNISDYDLVLCHAANLRYHYRFLKKYGKRMNKVIFFFHGHEVLKINDVYSKPFKYMESSFVKRMIQNLYDELKFILWRKYFESNYYQFSYVFVSNWMKDEFMKWVHPKWECLEGRYSITYNSVNEVFEDNNFDWNISKDYDFITIRGYLDNSKYGVDIVNSLARNNPKLKFLLIGRGEFFDHYEKADNLIWLDQRMNQIEMIEWMNKAKCALMPTRTDAQGVMMCEMATFGMPVITSDIPVCHEVFNGFNNIAFINNDNYSSIDLNSILKCITKDRYPKNPKYLNSLLIEKETSFFTKCLIK